MIQFNFIPFFISVTIHCLLNDKRSRRVLSSPLEHIYPHFAKSHKIRCTSDCSGHPRSLSSTPGSDLSRPPPTLPQKITPRQEVDAAYLLHNTIFIQHKYIFYFIKSTFLQNERYRLLGRILTYFLTKIKKKSYCAVRKHCHCLRSKADAGEETRLVFRFIHLIVFANPFMRKKIDGSFVFVP